MIVEVLRFRKLAQKSLKSAPGGVVADVSANDESVRRFKLVTLDRTVSLHDGLEEDRGNGEPQ